MSNAIELAEAIRNKSDELKRIGDYSVEAETLIEIAWPNWRRRLRHNLC